MKLAILVPSLLVLGLASCAVPKIDALARYGIFDADGDLGIASSGAVATNDFDDLGIDDDDSVLGARVDVDLGSPHLIASAQRSNHGGDGTLSAELSQGGVTIPAGTDVSTDFDLGIYDLVLVFDLIPTDTFELGLGLGISAVSVDATFTETGTSNRVDTDETLPIPVLAVTAGVSLGSFEVAALLAGMDISYDDDDLAYLDFDAFGRWGFFGGDERLRLSLVVGYRVADFDLEYDDDDEVVFDATFDGPYAGLEFSF